MKKKVIKSNPVKEEKPFILNDKNAIPFFFEYSKKIKKIRLGFKPNTVKLIYYYMMRHPITDQILFTWPKKYFDGTYFHRIVKDFIIQGGNSDSYEISKRERI